MLALMGAAALIFSAVTAFMSWQIFCMIPLLVGLACLIAGLRPLSAKAKNLSFRISVVSLFIAFVVAFGLIQYANRLGYPIKIVVPDGYKGKVWVVIDKAKGQTPALVDGVWVFNIPASGLLMINDDAAYKMGHQEDYYFANGQRITVMSDDVGSYSADEPYGYWAIIP